MTSAVDYLKDMGPEWVQAWGTIIALLVAIFAAWLPHHFTARQAKRDREIMAGSLAVGLFPELLELQIKIIAIEKYLECAAELPPGHLIPRLSLKLPPILHNSLDRLYLLGKPAGPTIQQMATVIMQYDRAFQKLLAVIQYSGNSDDPVSEHFAYLKKHVGVAKKLLGEALEQIAPIHDWASE